MPSKHATPLVCRIVNHLLKASAKWNRILLQELCFCFHSKPLTYESEEALYHVCHFLSVSPVAGCASPRSPDCKGRVLSGVLCHFGSSLISIRESIIITMLPCLPMSIHLPWKAIQTWREQDDQVTQGISRLHLEMRALRSKANVPDLRWILSVALS